MEVSQKIKNRTTSWPSNSTPGYILEKNKNTTWKRYTHPNVHSNILYYCQDMEATYMSLNRWMDKEDMIYMYNGILLSHKKEQNSAICSNMDGLGGHYTKK